MNRSGRSGSCNPDLVILDIADAPDLGIKFAQFLERDHARHPLHRGRSAAPARAPAGRDAGRRGRLPAEAGRHRGAARRALTGSGTPRPPAARKPPKQPGQVYAFYSPKGGAGTTTVGDQLRGGAAPADRQADPAGGPGPGAGRDRPPARGAAAVQLRGHGAELPPDGRRAARVVHRAARARASTCCRRRTSPRRPRWSPARRSGGSCSSSASTTTTWWWTRRSRSRRPPSPPSSRRTSPSW